MEKLFYNYYPPAFDEIFSEEFKEEIKREKIIQFGVQVSNELDEEKLEAFLNGEASLDKDYDCKSLYELGVLKDEQEAADFLMGAISYGVQFAAKNLDYQIEETEVHYFYGPDLDDRNVMLVSILRSPEDV